jgi:hypothetical protein
MLRACSFVTSNASHNLPFVDEPALARLERAASLSIYMGGAVGCSHRLGQSQLDRR